MSFVFHACGSMMVETEQAQGASPLGLPPLPDQEPFDGFFDRTRKDPLQQVVVDWRIRSSVWLRMITVCQRPFEATWGRTTGNPRRETRGTVYLRTPGRAVRYGTVFELHAGAPRLVSVTLEQGGLSALTAGGERLAYHHPRLDAS